MKFTIIKVGLTLAGSIGLIVGIDAFRQDQAYQSKLNDCLAIQKQVDKYADTIKSNEDMAWNLLQERHADIRGGKDVSSNSPRLLEIINLQNKNKEIKQRLAQSQLKVQQCSAEFK